MSSSNRTPPAYADFDACHDMARAAAAALTAAGQPARVVSGYFHPGTPLETWDYRWQELTARFGAARGFIHYWVETAEGIVDPAVRQFGYPGPIDTDLADPRYERTASSYLGS